MITGVVYDGVGRILGQYTCRTVEGLFEQVSDDPDLHVLIGEADSPTEFVENDRIVPRPAMQLHDTVLLVDGREHVLLSGIPPQTRVRFRGEDAGIVEGTELTFTPTEVGRWWLDVEPPFPWQRVILEVVAHEVAN